jgi:hypothetical protein
MAVKMAWLHHANGGMAYQSKHGRMGLWTPQKEEISQMGNISIVSSGRKMYIFLLRNNGVFTQKILWW